jgi:hypothetical protein
MSNSRNRHTLHVQRFYSRLSVFSPGKLGGDTNSETEHAGDERGIERVDIVSVNAVETKASPVLGNHSTREYLHAQRSARTTETNANPCYTMTHLRPPRARQTTAQR